MCVFVLTVPGGDATSTLSVLPPLLSMYGHQLVSLDVSYCTLTSTDFKALHTLAADLQTLVLHDVELSGISGSSLCFYIAKLRNLRYGIRQAMS